MATEGFYRGIFSTPEEQRQSTITIVEASLTIVELAITVVEASLTIVELAITVVEEPRASVRPAARGPPAQAKRTH